MGLDMYLHLRKYDSCGSFQKDFEEKRKDFYPEELKQFEIDERNFMSKECKYQVGYWRKANAIHKWFVDNCADGEDNCQPVYVAYDKAHQLLNLVKTVLDKHELAEELLPTSEGFFFGDTEYDEYYFADLEYTKWLLEKVIDLVDNSDYDIWYEASW